MTTKPNPLLAAKKINSLPRFSKIEASKIQETLEKTLEESKELVNNLFKKNSLSDDELIQHLQEIDNCISRVWSPVRHLNSVMNNDEWREAYTACLPLLSDYQTEMGQHKLLYKLILSLHKNTVKEKHKTQQRVIGNLLKNFKLSGIDLSKEKQKSFKKLTSELSRLSSRFSDNVLDSTHAWTKNIASREELDGLPVSAMEMVSAAAKQRDQQGWVITLDFPIFNAVMTYANDRELRKEVYIAFTTRASEQAENKKYDNSLVMEKILELRTQRANMLDFTNYAEQSLFKKMADDPHQVIEFLNDLLNRAKPQAEQEIRQLAEFAKNELNIKKLEAWDTAYIAESIKNKKLKYSEEDIKPWFSVDNVLTGLFELVEKLYGCRIQQKQGVDVWHEDVRFYEIINGKKQHIASFYLDLYTRQHKRGGAWMDSLCGRFVGDSGEIQIPVAYMTCNSSPPGSKKKPALFTHKEVITLFHEFGHGLHHMLTTVDYLDISGINGVEWDAVELPSQFMENWCWERESLDMFAKHYETGELIPDELYNKMLNTRHFNSAMAMLRQIEFALFDMHLHMRSEKQSYADIVRTLETVREKTSLVDTPAFNRFQNSFSHIFAGGYAAGYYSYLWAEVLSADAFAKFEDTGLFNHKTAEAFLQEVLEKGGSRPARESFIRFMGREPDISALLRHSGIN